MTNTERLRLSVFKLWFCTLAVVVVVFAVRAWGLTGVKPLFSDSFQSFEMIIGLVIPQISVMVAFYFTIDQQQQKIESLSRSQVSVLTWLSIAYHAIFVATIVAGIGFNAFDQTPGQPMRGNAAAISAIMGLFSVFLAPVAFLFSQQITSNQPAAATPSAAEPPMR
jgi:hypothetical protein